MGFRSLITRIRETSGPTVLPVGAVADGQYLKRVGSTIVSGDPASGGGSAGAISYLGYNTVGGSTDVVTAGRQYMKKITVAGNGILVNIAIYIEVTAQQQLSIAVGVLGDSAGTPTIALAAYAEHSNTGLAMTASSPRWFAFPIGLDVVAGDYWIAFQSTGGATKNIYYDAGTDNYTTPANSDIRDVTSMTGDTLNVGAKKYSFRAAFLPTA